MPHYSCPPIETVLYCYCHLLDQSHRLRCSSVSVCVLQNATPICTGLSKYCLYLVITLNSKCDTSNTLTNKLLLIESTEFFDLHAKVSVSRFDVRCLQFVSHVDAFWGKGFLDRSEQQAQTAKRPEKDLGGEGLDFLHTTCMRPFHSEPEISNYSVLAC